MGNEGLICYYCKAKFRSVLEIVKHTKTGCSKYKTGAVGGFLCGSCTNGYTQIASFRRHLLKNHVPSITPSPCRPTSPVSSIGFRTPDSTPVKSESTRKAEVPSACPVSSLSDKEISEFLTDQMASAVSTFHNNTGMTFKAVQTFVESFRSLQQDALYCALNHLHSRFDINGASCEHVGEFLGDLKRILDSSFHPLRSRHSREKFFSNKGSLILPQPVTLGQRAAVIGSTVPSRPHDVNAQFIPIRQTLARILSIPALLAEIDDWELQCASSPGITNFCQGSTWLDSLSKRPADCDRFYPLHFYFDDIETRNALGSRSGAQKLGACYVSLPFLPPRLAAKLNYILLVLVFKSHDRDHFGNEATFSIVIKELNFLFDHGITVQVEGGGTEIIKFGLGCLVGDNLGLNSMLGFTTSFNSLRCCRFCRATKHDFPQLLVEDSGLLRDDANYYVDLEQNDPSTTGVVEKCTWLNVHHFSLSRNVTVDFMHDILEGVSRYVMKTVLCGLIDHGNSLNLSYLNERIENFDYGPDFGSKPPHKIKSPKSGVYTIRMSASEMKVFITYFGLMVGHLIDECFDYYLVSKPVSENRSRGHKRQRRDSSYRFYKLYLLLHQIIELVTHHTVTQGRANYLASVIQEFLTLNQQLSSEIGDKESIPPKFHFLIHYSTMMMRHGPLYPLSSMRFESKHRVTKSAITSIATSVNTPKSAAEKLQYQLNDLLLNNQLPPKVNIPSKIKMPIPPNEFLHVCDSLDVPVGSPLTEIKHVTTADSVYFKLGYILCTDLDDEGNPVFMKIKNMYFNEENNKVYVKGNVLLTLGYVSHFQAYEVVPTEIECFSVLPIVEYPFPNTLTLAFDGSFYVTMRNSC